MTPRELRGLLTLARRGDDGAFERFVVATREGLFSRARRLVGRDAVAEEILQESYLALWSSEAPLPENPEAWLVRVSVNRALDEVRKEARRGDRPLADSEGPADASPDPLAQVKGGQVGERLERLIAALPPAERAVFVLRAVEEWPFEEIALRMGTAASTCRNQFLAARRRLAAALEPLGEIR